MTEQDRQEVKDEHGMLVILGVCMLVGLMFSLFWYMADPKALAGTPFGDLFRGIGSIFK